MSGAFVPVELKPSFISGAGIGVFSSNELPCNIIVMEYLGEKLTKKQSKVREQAWLVNNPESRVSYIFEYGDTIIDSASIYLGYTGVACDTNTSKFCNLHGKKSEWTFFYSSVDLIIFICELKSRQ
ncbi:hypothetical protein GEMRC1_010211 [Eukaryota sp. GEM-RC1]